MHIIAKLDTPDAGSLAYAGQDALALSPKSVSDLRDKKFGFVFQQFFLTPGTSVLDNVTLPLKIAGDPSNSRRARGLEVLLQFDLEDKASSRATDLSGAASPSGRSSATTGRRTPRSSARRPTSWTNGGFGNSSSRTRPTCWKSSLAC